MFRRATEEVDWHGVTIPKDAILFARFASANQDGDQFPEPEKFDLTRPNLKEQVAFGKGASLSGCRAVKARNEHRLQNHS